MRTLAHITAATLTNVDMLLCTHVVPALGGPETGGSLWFVGYCPSLDSETVCYKDIRHTVIEQDIWGPSLAYTHTANTFVHILYLQTHIHIYSTHMYTHIEKQTWNYWLKWLCNINICIQESQKALKEIKWQLESKIDPL